MADGASSNIDRYVEARGLDGVPDEGRVEGSVEDASSGAVQKGFEINLIQGRTTGHLTQSQLEALQVVDVELPDPDTVRLHPRRVRPPLSWREETDPVVMRAIIGSKPMISRLIKSKGEQL